MCSAQIVPANVICQILTVSFEEVLELLARVPNALSNAGVHDMTISVCHSGSTINALRS